VEEGAAEAGGGEGVEGVPGAGHRLCLEAVTCSREGHVARGREGLDGVGDGEGGEDVAACVCIGRERGGER
jgi:hypothetical protein